LYRINYKEFLFSKISKQTEDEIKKIERARRKNILDTEKSSTNIIKRNKEFSNLSLRVSINKSYFLNLQNHEQLKIDYVT
jgi:hypothetical protein